MSRGAQKQIASTDHLASRNSYAEKLLSSEFGFCEKKSTSLKGKWREEAFQKKDKNIKLDLEIGIGKGSHFAHYAKTNSDRLILGGELKFKLLIQSLNKASCSSNARVFRYNASFLEDLFNEQEIDDVMIYFPDPWPKKRHSKHRLIQVPFLEKLHKLQRKKSKFIFKTDSLEYFHWALEKFVKSPYTLEELSFCLQDSAFEKDNFVTEFEQIFRDQNVPIKYAVLSV